MLVGEVAGDLRVAGEAALIVVQGSDDRVGPEAGAVLADPPAGVLDAAEGAGLVEELERQAGPAVLVGVEDREVLADDLVGGVALDGLGAGVPGLDDPVPVEGEDRVVANLGDQGPEALFAASQRLLESVLLGEVA